ncbi:MAG: EAL domain-containing protein [Acidobacteriota bacterium]|nr:EAL domain-containing protein [Acidobacteriota bacterium]
MSGTRRRRLAAGNLNFLVVAEGVETEQQRAQLSALECEFGQGYYFSMPVDSDAAEAFFLRCFPPAGRARGWPRGSQPLAPCAARAAGSKFVSTIGGGPRLPRARCERAGSPSGAASRRRK